MTHACAAESKKVIKEVVVELMRDVGNDESNCVFGLRKNTNLSLGNVDVNFKSLTVAARTLAWGARLFDDAV